MQKLLFSIILLGFVTSLPSSTTSSKVLRREESSTFYIVDNDSGSLANAVSDPSGIFFGPNRQTPTLFTIDSSTGILMTADPGQTVYDSYIEDQNTAVQIGTAASSGFLRCSVTNDQLTCSADESNTEFLLDSTSDGSSQLHLVQPASISGNARGTTLGVQYSTSPPAATPTKFYLSTSQGWAVDFGSNSGIYSGTDYAKKSPGSVYTLDSNTGYLMTASTSGDSSDSSNIAHIDTTTSNGYSPVQLLPSSASSATMTPLVCQIADDGSLAFSCKADTYEQLWLDLGKSTSGDYTLYIAKSDSTGNGSQRLDAQVVVSNCSTCT